MYASARPFLAKEPRGKFEPGKSTWVLGSSSPANAPRDFREDRQPEAQFPVGSKEWGLSFAARWEEIRTGFERPFWIANLSEIFERLSYYGAFAPLALSLIHI